MGTNDLQAKFFLFNTLAGARGRSLELGKPLCRYRLSIEEAKLARGILLKHNNYEGPNEIHISALFCLFAADTLRRHHAGGAWSWSTVTSVLGPYYDQVVMKRFVEQGLRFWKRTLRENGKGRRFLGSLVLEGGIPLALIGRTDFAYFLRQLQRDLDNDKVTSLADAEMLADRRASTLPPAWRQDDTLTLAAELLIRLREWRKFLPGHINGAESVEYLNKQYPNWREDLPLDLDDQAAAKLISSLLAAPRVQSPTLRPLTALVRRVFVRSIEGWKSGLSLEGVGLLPSAITTAPPFASKDPPLRVRFLLESEESHEIAFAEREGEERWRFQPLRRKPLPLSVGEEATARLLVDGNDFGELHLPGGEPLADLPWLLENLEEDSIGDDPTVLVHVGYGSRSTSRDSVFLAVDPRSGCLEAPPESIRELGPITGTQRIVFEVTASAVWREHGERNGIRLQPGAKRIGDTELLSVNAKKPNWKVLHPSVTIGPPEVGASSGRPGARIWLRPVRKGIGWEPLSSKAWCAGEMDVALIEDNTILDRRRILYLPPNAQVSTTVRSGRECTVRVSGVPTRKVRIEGFPDAIGEATDKDLLFRIALPEPPPADLTIVTALDTGGGAIEVKHRMPLFLAKGGFVGPDGRILKGGALDTFGACGQLMARGSGRFDDPAEISVRLTAPSTSPLADLRLGMNMTFMGEMPLGRLRRILRRLCTTAYSQDAELQLEVLRGGIPGPVLRLAAFAFTVHVDPGKRQAYLWSADGRTITRRSGLELSALSLVNPSEPPIPLLHDGALAWALPTENVYGPLLIVGAADLTGLVRPRVWFADQSSISTVGVLASIVGIKERSMRMEAFKTRLHKLAEEPYAAEAAADWALLDATLDAAGNAAPALSFELLEAVARVPAVLPSWILRADEARLTRLATLEDELPVAWSQVPISKWLQSARAMLEHYANANPELVKEIIASRLSDFCFLCPPVAGAVWYVREHLGLPHSPNEPKLEQLKHPEFRLYLRQLVGFSSNEAVWRSEIETATDWQNLSQDTRVSAPVVAAQYAVSGKHLSERMLAAIRFCRHIAEDQFDQRFRLALQSEFAEASTRPEPGKDG